MKLTTALVPLLLLLSACGGGASSDDAPGVYQVLPAAGGGIDAKRIASEGFDWIADSVPSSDGSTFYFIGQASSGVPAVFEVSASGGAPKTLASGSPLSWPLGIVISSDDETLYVADSVAGLFALPVSGGTPTLVAGTDCIKPTGLDIVEESGTDQIYFATAPGACNGGAGLAKVAASGGTPSFLASGAPFTFPSGVAVASNGDVYVANATENQQASPGSILVVKAGGSVDTLASDLSLGIPAGISLDMAGSTLLVSAHASDGGDEVVFVTLASGATTSSDTGIRQNTGAAGLHRASKQDVFSWADTPASPMPTRPIIFK